VLPRRPGEGNSWRRPAAPPPCKRPVQPTVVKLIQPGSRTSPRGWKARMVGRKPAPNPGAGPTASGRPIEQVASLAPPEKTARKKTPRPWSLFSAAVARGPRMCRLRGSLLPAPGPASGTPADLDSTIGWGCFLGPLLVFLLLPGADLGPCQQGRVGSFGRFRSSGLAGGGPPWNSAASTASSETGDKRPGPCWLENANPHKLGPAPFAGFDCQRGGRLISFFFSLF